MSARWTLNVKGGRRVRIRKGELYGSTLDDGTTVSFQEQVGHRGTPVHTHIWIQPPHPDTAIYLAEYLLRGATYYPYKSSLLAFVQGWDLNDPDEAETQVEIVVNRKLSQQLFDFVCWYVEEAMEAVNGYAAMASLFGDNS